MTTGPGPTTCPLCGGTWIDGRVAMPIVGSLRFSYRLGTSEIATEVAARMCGDCGNVNLRATDPDRIIRARAAARFARKPHRQDG